MMTPAYDYILKTARILNSPDVRAWPATSIITKLEFRPSGVHVEHTKRFGEGSWPEQVTPGWDGPLQYTLWIFIQMAGSWYGSGCIQYWRTHDENGGPPEQFAQNWYYDANRWAPMTGYQPRPGEQVGFMVTAGDARNNGHISVQERSNLVLIPFPKSGETYSDTSVVPDVPITPEPPEPPKPDDPPNPDYPHPTDVAWMLASIRDEQVQLKVDITHVLEALVSIRLQLDRGFTNRYAGDILPKK